MRLLSFNADGEIRLAEYFGKEIPLYAIMSHTWGSEEVKFQDVIEGTASRKEGYKKLFQFGEQAVKDGLLFFWADTCCIDARRSAELSEAINETFLWFQRAECCYVYLADIALTGRGLDTAEISHSLRGCHWFTRSWTLQELIAPENVKFFSADGVQIGDKASLSNVLHEITGIPLQALQGSPLREFRPDERMTWAQDRHARRPEDEVYCLLGIMGINLPLLYGEGKRNAAARLRRQINDTTSSPGCPSQKEIDLALRRAEQTRRDFFRLNKDPPYYGELGDRNFRVLTLNPGVKGSMLTGHIEEFDLENPPLYHALSYVWGDEPVIRQIVVNQEITSIRPNLHHALERIRALQSVQIRLWVDTLCINQRSNPERSKQVMSMAEIYRKAGAVLIWLGEEDWTSRLAIDFVKDIYERKFPWQYGRAEYGEDEAPLWQHGWWDEYGFTALRRLLERPWFRRAWVLQEAALATSSNLQCGNRQIHMTRFLQVIAKIRFNILSEPFRSQGSDEDGKLKKISMTFQDASPAMRMLNLINNASEVSEDDPKPTFSNKMSLEELVDRSTFSESSDKRDTIYALLNLANDAGSQSQTDGKILLVPDYEKSVLDVYTDFVVHCIRSSDSLDIIVRPWAPTPTSDGPPLKKGSGPSAQQIRQLPSWIATREKLPYGDVSGRSKHRLHANPLVGNSSKRIYSAHGRTTPVVLEDPNCHRSDTLAIKGIIVTEIGQRSSRMANAIITEGCLSLLKTPQLTSSTDHDDSSGIWWRTLCADRDAVGNAAPSSWHTALEDLLTLLGDDIISGIDIEELHLTDIPSHIREYLVVVQNVVWNRRTFRSPASATGQQFVGLIPPTARNGDQICILYGCSVPVVLRKVELTDQSMYWQLIGEAYVHGIMNGEYVSEIAGQEYERTFIIR